jgi:hypothetical protein
VQSKVVKEPATRKVFTEDQKKIQANRDLKILAKSFFLIARCWLTCMANSLAAHSGSKNTTFCTSSVENLLDIHRMSCAKAAFL